MFRITNLQWTFLTAAEPAAWVYQINGIERAAAVIALIATGRGKPAVRACSFDIAIRQKAAVCWAIGRLHSIFEDVALLVEPQEEILGNTIMVFRTRLSIQVPGHSQPIPHCTNLLVITCYEFTRSNTFAFGIDENGGAVLIATGNHENMITR